MRCEPKLHGSWQNQIMWLKTLSAISLLTLSNIAEHYNLLKLVFPYHILASLLINNIVCVFCTHRDIHFFSDFVWKLATALSHLNVYSFQIKVALDTMMILNQIALLFQTKPAKRLHKQDSHHAGVTTYLERRPSIHKTTANHVETKVNETFLAQRIFSLNLGKPTPKQNVKRSSDSESSNGGFDFSKVKLNQTNLREDFPPNSWTPSPRSNSHHTTSLTKTSPDSSLLKPSRLSFSPVAESSSDSQTVSQTLFYSNTPRVVYVQIPSVVAEQGYLKLICYLFTLVIVYIIYNEYRISKMYSASAAHT
uniref:Uncharacterized protein n=2 Tax=Cacopsylla melanoneura TaxID=428564 RepID=A0A8D8WEA9_9HEMI